MVAQVSGLESSTVSLGLCAPGNSSVPHGHPLLGTVSGLSKSADAVKRPAGRPYGPIWRAARLRSAPCSGRPPGIPAARGRPSLPNENMTVPPVREPAGLRLPAGAGSRRPDIPACGRWRYMACPEYDGSGGSRMARAGTALASVSPVEIDYLSSDGEPVANSCFQRTPLFYVRRTAGPLALARMCS